LYHPAQKRSMTHASIPPLLLPGVEFDGLAGHIAG
jgi:hypothetical protein